MEPTARGSPLKTIVPSTRQVNREAQSASEQSQSSLREELVRIFQNPADLSDDSLFIEMPTHDQRHNNLSPLSSPLFLPTDLPSIPSDSPPSYSFSDPLTSTSDLVHLSAPSLQLSSYISIAPSLFSIISVPILSETGSPSTPAIYIPPTIPPTQICNMAQPAQIYFPIPGHGERGAPTVDITKP